MSRDKTDLPVQEREGRSKLWDVIVSRPCPPGSPVCRVGLSFLIVGQDI